MRDCNVTGSHAGNSRLSIHGHGYHLPERSVQIHEPIATVNVLVQMYYWLLGVETGTVSLCQVVGTGSLVSVAFLYHVYLQELMSGS